MRKKYKILLGVIVVAFIAWAAVTIYFYQQHTVTTKSIKISGWELEEGNEQVIQWKEILLVNKTAAPDDFDKIARKFDFASKLPIKLQNIAMRLMLFYDKRLVESPHGWTIIISGIALKSDNKSQTDRWMGMDLYLVDENGVPLYLSEGSRRNDDNSNMILYEKRDDKFDPNIRPQKLIWYWDKEKQYELNLTDVMIQTRKYSFFDRKPEATDRIFSFYAAFRDYFINIKKDLNDLVYDEDTQHLLKSIKDNKNSSINYHRPFYIGTYKNFTDVFALRLTYLLERNTSETEKEIIIYFVEEEGKWRSVDVKI
ncbi:hypothetical protein BHU72_09995 [Desulfuribacillus stibiiarsenatis]|uniref:Uncharacterized protein n=1 Tax=Desulfuribacillus stibiiarsenatis TaxID=1390249 RepID=A0A1E5L9G4_9FIRM|nr:hypothetical protein [Desulfuribacillus stibiiarsenatis]OEH86583.1 hypothetical protein BHU72_09995 [Desulfuribacillus stibiiarsenatis]